MDTGGWAGGKRGKEAGPRGDRQEARRTSYTRYQDRPRTARRARKDSPTAQRSANRSSPSSAWIRSFRLFLVAALFNTALNKGGGRGPHEPAPSSPASGRGSLSEHLPGISYPGPQEPLSVFRAKGIRNLEGMPLSLSSMMMSVQCYQGDQETSVQGKARAAAHTLRPGKSREVRQVCRGSSTDWLRAPDVGSAEATADVANLSGLSFGVKRGRPSCPWGCASLQAGDHGHADSSPFPGGPRLCSESCHGCLGATTP